MIIIIMIKLYICISRDATEELLKSEEVQGFLFFINSPQVGATSHSAHEEAPLALHHLLRAQTGQRWVMNPLKSRHET